MPPKATGPFKSKEKVLVPHTDKMYEAKIMKSEKRGEMWFYFIHYQGWGKKWDEWVEAPGLFKFDPAKKDASPAAMLEQGNGVDAEADQPESAGVKRKATPAPKKQEKRRKANDIAPLDVTLPNEAAEPAVDVRLTSDLKQVLLDESEAYSRGLKGPKLPRTPSVADILLKYVESERGFRHSTDVQEQFASGLRTYFDKAVYHSLLYDQEVEECQEMLAQGIMPSSQYGAEHLLRLLAKLPTFIPITAASADGFASLQDQLISFVLFLNSRTSEMFLKNADYSPS